MTWFARWKRGTKAQALVSAYRDLPAEHSETATYSTVDSEGVYRVFVLTPSRCEWFAADYWERVAGTPALSAELD